MEWTYDAQSALYDVAERRPCALHIASALALDGRELRLRAGEEGRRSCNSSTKAEKVIVRPCRHRSKLEFRHFARGCPNNRTPPAGHDEICGAPVEE